MLTRRNSACKWNDHGGMACAHSACPFCEAMSNGSNPLCPWILFTSAPCSRMACTITEGQDLEVNPGTYNITSNAGGVDPAAAGMFLQATKDVVCANTTGPCTLLLKSPASRQRRQLKFHDGGGLNDDSDGDVSRGVISVHQLSDRDGGRRWAQGESSSMP